MAGEAWRSDIFAERVALAILLIAFGVALGVVLGLGAK